MLLKVFGQLTDRRGVAIATVLMLSVFLFVLGIGYLYMLDRDQHQQIRAERMNRALYVAKSGIDYFTFKEIEAPNSLAGEGVVSGPYEMGPGEFFRIEGDGENGCTVHAWLQDSSGRRLAEQTLVMPGNHRLGGDRNAIYDPSL